VAAQARDAAAWAALARRAESLGYDCLLVPDTADTLAPVPAAASAAATTSTLRVGTYVLAAPWRPPAVTAWEVRSLHLLTGGRFELGLGAGRPDAERDAAALGVPFLTAGERLRQVEAVIDAVRAAMAADAGALRVLVAAGGPRMLRLAARRADTVAFGLPPTADEGALRSAVDVVRDEAGPRFDDVELSANLLAVGDRLPPGLERWIGADIPGLVTAGSTAVLTGDTARMADTLTRRRDLLGVSYVVTNGFFADALAPVVERLAGR
jgi:probable F420-dependent oxidoreductase